MHARQRRSERRFARQALRFFRARFNPYLCGAGALAMLTLGFTFNGGTRAWSQADRPKALCALAMTPAQITKEPQLEPVYCHSIVAGQCHGRIGWVVVSEPVPCE